MISTLKKVLVLFFVLCALFAINSNAMAQTLDGTYIGLNKGVNPNSDWSQTSDVKLVISGDTAHFALTLSSGKILEWKSDVTMKDANTVILGFHRAKRPFIISSDTLSIKYEKEGDYGPINWSVVLTKK